MQIGSAHRDDVRRTVEGHRAAQREEVRREEAAAGRRLTPAELAELRKQVRQQSSLRLSGEEGTSGGVSKGIDDVSHKPGRSLTMPRSQRQ